MRRTDGGVWRLRWQTEGQLFFGEVVGHPSVRATGATFESMAEVLYDGIRSKLQAGEWTADWNPPPPPGKEAVGSSLATHVLLRGEGRFVRVMAPSDVFESFCKDCGSPTGPRTRKPLQVWIEEATNICFDFGTGPGDLLIYSNEIASAILGIPGAKKWIQFRPCVRLGRGRKQFSEAILKPRVAPPESVRMKTNKEYGWHCPRCMSRSDFTVVPGHQPTYYYHKHDIPETKGLFCLSQGPDRIAVCVPLTWWRKHAATALCRGVTSGGIGIADETKVADGPERRQVSDLATFQRHARLWFDRQVSIAEHAGLPAPAWKV